jgi:hypothetical protein
MVPMRCVVAVLVAVLVIVRCSQVDMRPCATVSMTATGSVRVRNCGQLRCNVAYRSQK